ncbi:MAG: geranylgeranyl reductase family protein [Ignavibacteria bacterium]|nr:geranylgeranyl reductase family protein [Ignavibacteria bacterium]
MKDRYDVLVVGAGPAGSTVARLVAREGFSVLLLEKDRDVGTPVRCGEAVSNRSLESIVDVDPRWIAATIRRFRLVAPDGSCVEPDLGGHGYVLERRLFDYDLARMAVDAGAELRTKAYVDGLLADGGEYRGVTISLNGERRTVGARIIVGADGVESRVGRWAGIDTTTPFRDMECCAQMTLADVDMEEDACEFHFGTAVAPMGYLWIFPKGHRTANIGVGVSGAAAKHKSPIRYLNEFVARRFPRAGILTTVAGGVPCAATLEDIVRGNVVLVGDAAHQVNPMSGGGITSGMHAARMAAEAIAGALRAGDLRLLAAYPKEWQRSHGAKHRTYHRMKEAVYRFPDERLNAIAAGVLALAPEQRTIWGVFRVALMKHPALVWDMAKTFGFSAFH